MPNINPLKRIVTLQKQGEPVGIYSCCSANEFVVEAVLENGKKDNSVVLIESTANQVDQNGGYTGMTPKDFKAFVYAIADKVGFPKENIYLGGDHLGPLTWAHLNEKEAMQNAKELIDCYVSAGFTKIHIDTSMKVADDDPNTRLSDTVIASRGAYLARVAEDAYQNLLKEDANAVRPVYIIGSEVPIPGGAQGDSAQEVLEVTHVEDFEATYHVFEEAFKKENLQETWSDVIGIVVQPGIEEKDAGCVEYDREKASNLMKAIKAYPNIVFEGHSSDYQTKYKLKELVEDGVGILKVGPGLTYKVREALFALSYIEDEMFHDTPEKKSNFRQVLDAEMLKNPKKWEPYYLGSENDKRIKRAFSFSDRERYYLPQPSVQEAIATMFNNLKGNTINLSLLSQFLPIQYTKVREGILANEPADLVKDNVSTTIQEYMFASHQEKL